MRDAGSFRIGDYKCWSLYDGELTYPGWTILPPEAKPPEHLSAPYIAMLVDTGPVRVLIDAGAGALGPDTGKLLQSLASTGFSPTVMIGRIRLALTSDAAFYTRSTSVVRVPSRLSSTSLTVRRGPGLLRPA